MLSAPTSTAPAASIRSISVASRGAGARSRLIFEPARVGKALHVEQVLHRERHAGERADDFCPAAIAASIARALARARSAVTSVKELRMALCCAIRASAASVASSAESLPDVTALAISEADSGVGVSAHGAIRL